MTNLKDCRIDAKTEEKRVKKEEEKRNGHRQQTNKLIHARGHFFMKNTPRRIGSDLETEILAT
jgi:hypothetical protein